MDTKPAKRFSLRALPADWPQAAAIFLAERGYRVFAARLGERRAALDARSAARKTGAHRDRNGRARRRLRRLGRDADRKPRAPRSTCSSTMPAWPTSSPSKRFASKICISKFENQFFGAVRVTQRVLSGDARLAPRPYQHELAGGYGWRCTLFGAYSGSKFALEGMSDAWRSRSLPIRNRRRADRTGLHSQRRWNRPRWNWAAAIAIFMERGPYASVYQRFVRSWR